MADDLDRIDAELDKITAELPQAIAMAADAGLPHPVTGRPRGMHDWKLAELAMRAEVLAGHAGLPVTEMVGLRSAIAKERADPSLGKNEAAIERRLRVATRAARAAVKSARAGKKINRNVSSSKGA